MIQVYFLDTTPMKDSGLFQNYYEQMSDDRKRKIDFYRFDKDKRLSLGAGILIERGLLPFGFHEKNMQYQTIQNKKPVFLNAPDIHFNVSHAGTMVMAVFSDCFDVGCDIEKITEIDLRIARDYFYKGEYESIMKAKTLKDRLEIFFRLWTMKESFMKVTGLGMELSLDSFEVTLSGDGNSWAEKPVRHGVNQKQYRIREISMFEGYKSSLCIENSSEENIQIIR